YLVQAAKPGTVNLTKIDRLCLQQLFEHYSIMTMFARCHADWRDRFANCSMAENIVGTCRFFDPPGAELGQAAHVTYGFIDIPHLVSIHHELSIPTDFFAQHPSTTNIRLDMAAHFLFEMGPTRSHAFTRQAPQLFIGVS